MSAPEQVLKVVSYRAANVVQINQHRQKSHKTVRNQLDTRQHLDSDHAELFFAAAWTSTRVQSALVSQSEATSWSVFTFWRLLITIARYGHGRFLTKAEV